MIQGIDHIVIISANLDEAISNAKQAGFTVVAGGTHKDGNTHNALIAFKDGSYIELISPTDGIEGKNHRWFPHLAKGGGLVDLCLASDNLEEDTSRIRETGIRYDGPIENGRARLDGVELQWKGSMPPGEVGETGFPFLIEDITPREHRVSDDAQETTHENGAIGIAGVTILTHNLAQFTADFEKISGRVASELTSPIDESPIAALINFDQSWLMLTHPTAGAAIQHLEQLGQGPFAVSLRTHDGPITPNSGKKIPAELLSGASVELV